MKWSYAFQIFNLHHYVEALISTTPEWKALQEHVKEIDETHLRDLMMDADRCAHLTAEHDGKGVAVRVVYLKGMFETNFNSLL